MTSIKVKLRTNGSGEKECALYYQIIHCRCVRQVKAGLKIYPREWSAAAQEVIPGADDKERSIYLQTVREQLAAARKAIGDVIGRLEQKGEFSVDQIVSAYASQTLNGNLFSFMGGLIGQLKERGHYRTSETYTSALRSFRRFRQGHDLDLNQMTALLMKEYEQEMKREGLRLNTISFYMRILRAVYNRAVDLGLVVQSHPFRHVYTGIEKTRKRAVGEEVILRLKRLDLSRSQQMTLARDLFLFSFYTRGMSFVDMAYLRKCDIRNGFIQYRRRKTGQQLSIRLEPSIENIINAYTSYTRHTEYLLPILDSGRSTPPEVQYANALSYQNRRLKQLSALMGLSEPLSSYVSRHTWATVARRRNIPLSVISEGMGHDSEITTQIYLASLDQHVIDRANQSIIRGL